jgi:hypothetical protein
MNTIEVNSPDLGKEAHILFFSDIIAAKKGTECSNFYVTVIANTKMSANRLVGIVTIRKNFHILVRDNISKRQHSISYKTTLKHLPFSPITPSSLFDTAQISEKP